MLKFFLGNLNSVQLYLAATWLPTDFFFFFFFLMLDTLLMRSPFPLRNNFLFFINLPWGYYMYTIWLLYITPSS